MLTFLTLAVTSLILAECALIGFTFGKAVCDTIDALRSRRDRK